MSEYLCPFCGRWKLIEQYEDHLLDHGNDTNVPENVPTNYEEFVRRYSKIGLVEER